MRARATNGSALLAVLMVMSLLVLWCSSYWRMTTYMVDGTHARILYEQQFSLANALLHYGVYFCKAHLQEILASQTPLIALRLGPWVLHNKRSYEGRLNIVRQNKQFNLTLDLLDTNKVVIVSVANTIKFAQVDGSLVITRIDDWRINERL